jgi:hypothetical protein
MKRTLILIMLLFVLFAGTAAAGEWELGLSASPKPVTSGENELNFMPGLHLGYGFAGIFYLSLDSLYANKAVTQEITGGIVDESFIHLTGGGLRLRLGPVMSYATVGPTWMTFQQHDVSTEVGANIKLGLGLRNDWWGVSLNGTQFFYDMDTALTTIGDLFSSDKSTRQAAGNRITDGMFPTLILTLYL